MGNIAGFESIVSKTIRGMDTTLVVDQGTVECVVLDRHPDQPLPTSEEVLAVIADAGFTVGVDPGVWWWTVGGESVACCQPPEWKPAPYDASTYVRSPPSDPTP